MEPGKLVPAADVHEMVVIPKQTAAQEIAYAAEIATELAKIIESKKLYKTIGNKKHVYVEAWTAVAALRGVTPREVSNERQEDGSYVAKVELVNADGRIIGAASAECGGPNEPTWMSRPPYSRRSMAATRATSKVCRLCFSWIMVLEGYSGTPAEEMSQDMGSDAPRTTQAAQEQGPKQATKPFKADPGWDGTKEIFFGKYSQEPAGPKTWSELPSAYLKFITSKMKDPALSMAQSEIARRAGGGEKKKPTSTSSYEPDEGFVEAEVTREPGSDDELPLGQPPPGRFDDDPRLR